MSRCDVDNVRLVPSCRLLTLEVGVCGWRCGWCSELNATDSSAAWRTDFRRCVMSAGSLRSKIYRCSLTFQPSALSAFRSQRRVNVRLSCSRRLLVSLPSLLSLVTSGQPLCSTSRDAPSFSFLTCLFPLLDRSPLRSRSMSISRHSNFNSTGARQDEMDDTKTRSRSEWRPRYIGRS